jgi:adenylate kinase
MTIIAVLGLSGVGKSTLIRNAGLRRELLHLSASELIKARLAHTSEQLRRGAVLDNQSLMLAEFADRVANAGATPVVFDGHTIIDTPAGLLEIPLNIFQAIAPSAIVFVASEPKTIAKRRAADTGRVRPERSIGDLAKHQDLALARARYFSDELKVPFHIIASDSVEELLVLL